MASQRGPPSPSDTWATAARAAAWNKSTSAQTLAPAPLGSDDRQHRIVDLVLDRLSSQNSQIACARALIDFLDWYDGQCRPVLSKSVVQRYRATLLDAYLAPSSINQKLSAIRALAVAAADNGLLDRETAAATKEVKGVKTAGTRAGNWLTHNEAEQLLDAPDLLTITGVRDRAILAILLGCGLRRAELGEDGHRRLGQHPRARGWPGVPFAVEERRPAASEPA